MLAPTLSYVVLLAMVSKPDYGPILLGYAGVLLLGMTALSTGVLTSTATQSQMAAYLSAFFFWLIVGVLGARGAAALGPPWDEYLYACLPRRHMANLARGAFHLADIVYFLSLTLVFLALAVKLLESRRWR
jgi:ABC-2 type transport system permease protein